MNHEEHLAMSKGFHLCQQDYHDRLSKAHMSLSEHHKRQGNETLARLHSDVADAHEDISTCHAACATAIGEDVEPTVKVQSGGRMDRLTKSLMQRM